MDSQPADLQFTTRRVNGHQVITVTGEIDIHTAPALEGYLRDTSGSDLVLDLSAVTFMDARGLTALLRADHRARNAGHHLRLAALTSQITRLLMITNLERYFAPYLTAQAATALPTTGPVVTSGT